ncbi:hypothetical protein H0A36_17475 [Endozoicomonas sp. SM1973]|uniref:Uncharacterized protein n=1 Tax=Spartinivicinus marinus TaxID=2994442 RepID=A0A853IE75_9GAMM|nr:hypothetical protein [Spartinivicinus marinus]MCX4030164.1 hypothetical protein [Spartinivicinus marinus]NYZ67807.1 hypothetical protein [Spartinivicinus marinus]
MIKIHTANIKACFLIIIGGDDDKRIFTMFLRVIALASVFLLAGCPLQNIVQIQDVSNQTASYNFPPPNIVRLAIIEQGIHSPSVITMAEERLVQSGFNTFRDREIKQWQNPIGLIDFEVEKTITSNSGQKCKKYTLTIPEVGDGVSHGIGESRHHGTACLKNNIWQKIIN